MQKQCAVKNLVIDPDVQARGTFVFHHVPCSTAFRVVLQSLGLGSVDYGNSVIDGRDAETMTKRGAIKMALVVAIIGVVAGALLLAAARPSCRARAIGADVDMLRTLWYGPVALIVAYAAGCVFAVPASIFIIAAGVVWGWKFGAFYAMCGAHDRRLALVLRRTFSRRGVAREVRPRRTRRRAQVASAGFKTMLVVRLIPGPPFAVWNYGAGVAKVKFSDYFFGTLLGTFPAHIIFAYCADALFNGTMTQGDAVRRLAIVAAPDPRPGVPAGPDQEAGQAVSSIRLPTDRTAP